MRLTEIFRRLTGKATVTPLTFGEPAASALAAISRQKASSDLPSLSLAGYRKAVTNVPRPAKQQMEDFADYVAGAKSWYKHLPLFPPGKPFTFYVDPQAGLDRIIQKDGQTVFVTRTKDTPHFHYAWRTTEKYRSSYGHLAFASAAGTRLLTSVSGRLSDNREIRGAIDNNPCRASIHVTADGEYQLPQEILHAGTTPITGIVHDLCTSTWFLNAGYAKAESVPWPEETGGAKTGRSVAKLCRALETLYAQIDKDAKNFRAKNPDDTFKDLEPIYAQARPIEDEFLSLLAPERSRLRREMVGAMNRVVALAWA